MYPIAHAQVTGLPSGKYENYHKLTMKELLQEAISEEENNIPLKDRKIKQRLISYRTFLLNGNLSQ